MLIGSKSKKKPSWLPIGLGPVDNKPRWWLHVWGQISWENIDLSHVHGLHKIKLGNFFDAQNLYETYPFLRDIDLEINVEVKNNDGKSCSNPKAHTRGEVSNDQSISLFITHEKPLRLNQDAIIIPENEQSYWMIYRRNLAHLLVHEIQHVIQFHEDWTTGTSPSSEYRKIVKGIIDRIDKRLDMQHQKQSSLNRLEWPIGDFRKALGWDFRKAVLKTCLNNGATADPRLLKRLNRLAQKRYMNNPGEIEARDAERNFSNQSTLRPVSAFGYACICVQNRLSFLRGTRHSPGVALS